MEMNRGEAEKCMDLGKKYLRAGNFVQAVKWFDKSIRLYPLPGAEALKARAEESARQSASAASASSSRQTSNSSSSIPTSSVTEYNRPYTEEQVKVVRQIKSCKTHYDVLGVAKSADENEIKRAYRKVW
jgi:DnaJ family protein B protein 14